MKRPSFCHFLGHEDQDPDLFGDVWCRHCGDLAPPWAHIGATSWDGSVPGMRSAAVITEVASAAVVAFQELTAAVNATAAALGPPLRAFAAALDELAPIVLRRDN